MAAPPESKAAKRPRFSLQAGSETALVTAMNAVKEDVVFRQWFTKLFFERLRGAFKSRTREPPET